MILGISSDDTQNHKKMKIMLLPQKFLNLYSHRLIRSTSGNLPTLLARITAHKNPLEAVLHTGIARAQIGNSADVCQLCSVLCPRIPCAEWPGSLNNHSASEEYYKQPSAPDISHPSWISSAKLDFFSKVRVPPDQRLMSTIWSSLSGQPSYKCTWKRSC